jgi:archaellum component FlaG (FlaF/FlaG flagellin family)
VKEISLSDSSLTDLIVTPFSNIDGIQTDDSSRVYLSPWSLNGIVRYDAGLNAPIDTVIGMNKPADIYYNRTNDTLAVPNSGNNTIAFINYHVEAPIDTTDTTTTSVRPLLREDGTFEVFPNPAKDRIQVWVSGNGSEELAVISLFDANGSLVRRQQIPLPGRLVREIGFEGSDLGTGTYFVCLQTRDRSLQQRIVLLP